MKKASAGMIGFAAAAAILLAARDLGELRPLLVNRTDEARKAVGIVAALVDANGQRVTAAGATAPGGTLVPDADTVFEIGSITKVFTSLVLADMVVRGEVKLDDPVAKLLPAAVKVPGRDGREITLLDLSNQVSGLPRLPGNLKPADGGDPYADYGPAKLYEFLSGHALTRAIGEKYEYSNLGVGLLGHALAWKAGVSYEELVRRRVLEPLGMSDTAITLPESMKARLAVPTGPSLRPVKPWAFDALAGAGALRSTANDMLKLLTAAMGLRETPLRRAFDLMLEKRRSTGTDGLDIGLGWHVWNKYGTEIVWHNGGTGGFRSFAGFAPAKKTGVVVLCNTSFEVDDLGLHALEPEWPAPLLKPPVKRQAVEVDEAVLQGYVGEYELRPGFTLTVTRMAGRLFVRATGQPLLAFQAESAAEFFHPGADIQIAFVKDVQGLVTHLILRQAGVDREARKIRSALKSLGLVVISPGNPGPVTLGFDIQLESGWHLYWVNPGDAGLAPAARWTLPQGFSAGPLRHPIPAKSVEDGLVSLKHKDEVLLLCDISPPAGWSGGPWEASAVLEWMACRESCVTGETPARAVIPPDAASLAAGRSLLGRFASRFPRPFHESGLTAAPARAQWTGAAWEVEFAVTGPRDSEIGDFFAHPVEGYVVDSSGLALREGTVHIRLIPSKGPGAPPPAAVGGVLVVAGAGYEITAAVSAAPVRNRTDEGPSGPGDCDQRR